jgi:hypothetical protein
MSTAQYFGYILGTALLAYWTWLLVFTGPFETLHMLHNIHLIFHEAGHTIFGFFGEFIGFMGGLLGQLIVPIICAVVLFRNGSLYGTLVCVWWLGSSFVDLAPYIVAAQTQTLPLIGGEHDFAYLLGRLGWLQYDILLERLFMTIGTSIMVLALIFMCASIAQTYRARRTIL